MAWLRRPNRTTARSAAQANAAEPGGGGQPASELPGDAEDAEPAVELAEPDPAEPAHNVLAPQQAEIEALLASGQAGEADRLFAALPAALAGEEWVATLGLKIAMRLGDDTRAMRHALQLRQNCPGNPRGYASGSFLMRRQGHLEEAEAIVKVGLEHCPNALGLLREAAELAVAAGAHELAEARYERMRECAPRHSIGYTGAIRVSMRQHKPKLTKRLLAEGLAKFPDDREMLQIAAREASRALLWEEAGRLWERLLALCPDDPHVALDAAIAFIGPRGGRKKRLPGVLRQLERVHEKFPDFVPAYGEHIRTLREAGRIDEAETMADAACARFPADHALAMAAARVAEDRGHHDLALARLEQARGATAPGARLEAEYARALSLAGRMDEADRVCAAAMALFPGNFKLVEQYVALATRKGDFTLAAQRADAALRRAPGNPQLRRFAGRVRALGEEGVDDTIDEPANAQTDEAAKAFFLRFESLGATVAGCEFGLVQRQFGAEPLGLLRWGNMPIEGLTDAIENRFEGLGSPESTRIVVQRASVNHHEYYLFDDRYRYWAHTFIKADDAPQDRVLTQSLRRLTFLRNKLIEDIEQATKIFVFKMTEEVEPEALDALFDALRRQGDVVLLGVTLASEAHPAGSLVMLRPGLFLGRVGMFMGHNGADGAGIDLPLWRRFCEDVARWRDQQGAASLEAAD